MTPTVLVVDDEALLRRITASVLAQHGFQVLTAASGAEAETIAAASPVSISVMLIDVILPDIRGPDLWHRLRATHPDAHAIFMTGLRADRLPEWTDTSLVVRWLRKPFTTTALISAIEETYTQ